MYILVGHVQLGYYGRRVSWSHSCRKELLTTLCIKSLSTCNPANGKYQRVLQVQKPKLSFQWATPTFAKRSCVTHFSPRVLKWVGFIGVWVGAGGRAPPRAATVMLPVFLAGKGTLEDGQCVVCCPMAVLLGFLCIQMRRAVIPIMESLITKRPAKSYPQWPFAMSHRAASFPEVTYLNIVMTCENWSPIFSRCYFFPSPSWVDSKLSLTKTIEIEKRSH